MENTGKIRVILVSSVTPSSYSAGPIVLQRHLVDNPEVILQVLKTEPKKGTLRYLLRRLLGRLGRTCCRRIAQDVIALWRGGWIDAELPAPEAVEIPTVVMTVAHQEACYAAMRYANKYQLPLVTIFHDWWPDIPPVHDPFRSIIERSFRRLYQESSLALCVSPGMKKSLGPHENAKVLLPIPAKVKLLNDNSAKERRKPFRILYSGTLHDYQSMLMDALELLKDHSEIRLEVRGNSASWPEVFKKEMEERGLLLPYASREEFESWLKTADAFLITQRFGEKHSHLMRTNFPSKLLEFAQLGKPLILWGPADASGPMWARGARGGSQAMVVDEENSNLLKLAVEKLSVDTGERNRLAKAAENAAAECFSPTHIQSQFIKHLNDLVVR